MPPPRVRPAAHEILPALHVVDGAVGEFLHRSVGVPADALGHFIEELDCPTVGKKIGAPEASQ